MDNKLLNSEEAAARLNMSKASFFRVARPHLPHVQTGPGMVRFRPADLDEYIEKCLVKNNGA